jgi:hypothetical protein
MRTERYIFNGYLSLYWGALQRHEFFRFGQDILYKVEYKFVTHVDMNSMQRVPRGKNNVHCTKLCTSDRETP